MPAVGGWTRPLSWHCRPCPSGEVVHTLLLLLLLLLLLTMLTELNASV
ncbi:hypothetical protein [Streptomyces luteolus]|uniref:Uncharacterized protein n=1 Tax=Streptomyces luteolus TaxID=3043615 RepID=A0ABT6SXM2_9ACTN|nr:hypothetical protein [Streptomyces sp. B-S-A12]MDI3420341.1 hypothetical protein [Streptomyces sp. B-S-A12]